MLTRYQVHDFDLHPRLQQEIEVISYICQSQSIILVLDSQLKMRGCITT